MLNQPFYNPFKQTGGNTPPVMKPFPVMGGNTPPIPYNPFDPNGAPPMGGNTPPILADGTNPYIQAPPAYQLPGSAGFNPATVATNAMNQITDSGGAYMSNARRRGLEFAAARKLGNSSIAAGASERAALEAAAPLFGEAMGLHKDREGRAFQGEQAQLDRNQQYTMAQIDDWKSSRQFNREFNGVLSMMPINSAYQLNSQIMNYAMDNPEVYTADVISGMSNFFNQNFQQILSQYFPNQYGGGG